MADDAQDKQLPATQRKIDKARREGQVERSRDLGHFGALGLGVAAIGAFAPELVALLQQLLGKGLSFDAAALASPQGMAEHLTAQSLEMLLVLLPLGAGLALVALVAGLLAGGWNFSWEALEPRFEKLDPIAGFKRLFAMESLVQTLKTCLVALVLGLAGTAWVVVYWADFSALSLRALPQALAGGGELVQDGLLLVGGVLGLFALVDVPLQRQMLLRRLRMDITELKKELRDTDGSPELKGRMRQRMREVSGRRMLAAVPTADLVVMNPTHFAVALVYDAESGGAPRVVAKGADLLALKIKEVAEAAGVPVLQAPPLARALFAHCELDQEIPARLFGAVAQVLAWVYQLRDAVAAGRAADVAPPQVEVPPDLDPVQRAQAKAQAQARAAGPGAGPGAEA
jgi:flagellar biosynthetic protein FlhB